MHFYRCITSSARTTPHYFRSLIFATTAASDAADAVENLNQTGAKHSDARSSIILSLSVPEIAIRCNATYSFADPILCTGEMMPKHANAFNLVNFRRYFRAHELITAFRASVWPARLHIVAHCVIVISCGEFHCLTASNRSSLKTFLFFFSEPPSNQ